MKGIQQVFAEENLNKIPKIRKAINTLKDQPQNRACLDILQGFFHTVHGTGSTIGLDEVAGPARNLEDRLSALVETGRAAGSELLRELEEAINTLEEKLKVLKETEEIKLPEDPDQPLPNTPRREILIVDDDPAIRQLVTDELSKRNFGVAGAGSAGEARKVLDHYLPDLILLDIVMPDKSGLELIKELRQDWRFKWTPIFFLTARSDPAEIIDGIKTGADDYIIKPFNVEDLAARIEAKIRRIEELHDMAIRDPLTGSFSRGYFMERLAEEIGRSSRLKKPFSVVMCDLDHFKEVNDKYGHQAGDFVLQEFASFLRGKFRHTDTIGRYGGEEFIILLPNADGEAAYKILERLREEWENTPLFDPYQNKQIKITFSAGISEFDRDGKTDQDIIRAADSALYLAKETGRNKVVLAGRSGQGAKISPPKILVVDDSIAIRNLLAQKLKKDFRVFLAEDGESALVQVKLSKPDLIIADLMMPGMGGMEMVKRIRSNQENKDIKIIALTGVRQKKTVFEAIKSGIDDYVVKPIDFKELEARIIRLLKRKKPAG